MLKIGLTGGIGSGKSTVAEILVKQGAYLIDADAISHRVTKSGGLAIPALREAFGEGVLGLDGSLSRDAMRQIMLNDLGAKAQLEGILHPLIGDQINQRIQVAEQSNAQIVILDIPLLVEGGSRWRNRLDAVWVVDCLPQTQVARVLQRSSWPVAQIDAVMAAQASRAQRLAACDAVLFNEGLSLATLENQVLSLLNQIKRATVA